MGGWERSAALSLLLLALTTLFLLDNGRGYFYWPGHHDWISAKNLALAENLAPEYNFALFHRLEPDQDGDPTPSSFYHRFPIGGFALIKLAILPFGDNLSAKILVGRTLMLAFFSAAAVLAYLALSRITGSQWIACAATGLAFSSYYCLLYSNMNCTEVAADLFAVMLVFHALTVFVQEGRFRQLLVKTCIALLLGWHVYALLLPFIVFSLASAMLRHTQFPNAAPLERMRHLTGLFFLSRPVALGAVALSFGLLVLLFGLLNEWFALDGAIGIMLIGDPRNAIGAPYVLEYYLAQRVYLLVQYPMNSGPPFSKPDLKNPELLDFIVTNWREPEVDTLTP